MVALLLAVLLVWPTGPSPEAEAYLLRQEQAIHPGPNLVHFPGLHRLARWRAADMGIRDYFAHIGVYRYLGRYGVHDWRASCEILAWNNFPVDISAAFAWSQWLASPTHRPCLVEADYDAVGVGTYKAADGRKYFVMIFTDQVERRVVNAGKWLRASVWGTKLKWLPTGTRLVQFNHRRDSAGRLWTYVKAAGRYGWVAAAGTRVSG